MEESAGAGSSPRVRSRHGLFRCSRLFRGIISACAEQTAARPWTRSRSRDHLRVCGADSNMADAASRYWGSSPRVRSRLDGGELLETAAGIISACAEQTTLTGVPLRNMRDHLRVCGADLAVQRILGQYLGSSPRVRSRPIRATRPQAPQGIISACAEQTRSGVRWSG